MIHSFRRQFLYELKSVLFGYPGFVYFDLGVSSIPVFVYHTIEPKIFESHLAYLRNNNYRTLSIHEYSNQLNREPVNNKFVLITIDDARSSVWRYAFPLLKKYGMNASVFVIPGFTIETNECRDNLFDVWNGKKNMEQIRNIDPEDNTLCTWQEILSMYKSGLINIESHTLFHREIFKSTKIVDYIIPEREVTPYNFNGSPYLSNSDIGKELNPDEYIGLPLFESAPLMLAGPRLNISPEFKAKCKEIYNYYNFNEHLNSSWRKEIKKLTEDPSNIKKYFNFVAYSENDVTEDLQKAREIIQNKLDKNAGNHLCLPWTIGNRQTIRIAKELGMRSCFWGAIPEKKKNKSNDNLFFISRIKNDFIFRLPGENRKNILLIYYQKLIRRVSKEPIF